jgi:uncharacterized protein (DUF885 family)
MRACSHAVVACTRTGLLALALALGALFGCAAPGPPGVAPSAVDAAESTRAQALFAAHWEELLRLYPEQATRSGEHRYGDRLNDASAEGLAAQDAWWRSQQQLAQALNRQRLSAADQTSLDLLQHQADDQVQLQRFDGWRTMNVSAAPFGFQGALARLLRVSPVQNRAQAEQMLARLAAYPRRVEQEIARLRQGIAAGWVPPRPSLVRVLAQLDAQLAGAPQGSPFFEPFERLGSAIAAADQQALRGRAERAIVGQVLPATRRLRDFVATEYLAAAPAEGALAGYPGGDQVYAALVRSHTTTSLSPQQVHTIGRQQVAALRAEMDALMRSTGFSGNFAAFVRLLNSDPKFFHDSPDALLAGYRDIAKRIDAELPRLFAELPRTPYGIRAMPAFMGIGAADTYDPPADASAAGWFNANVLAVKTRPKWGMATLVAHEAVPGHHLQWARAAELPAVPAFRRRAMFTAYGEGWALYAETLGAEIGLYADPYSRFGHLQAQLFRASRLVVDTGIHALGWTRRQAIDTMLEQTGMDAEFIASEVDRYTAWPGQALAYMLGELKIVELRERARAALGERFDIRRFHMAVLDSGQVPLDLLERQVDGWIEAQRAGEPARGRIAVAKAQTKGSASVAAEAAAP